MRQARGLGLHERECLVNGGPELFEDLEERYADEPTSVEEVECLAACDTAPVMQVNYEFHGNQNPEVAAAIVEEYKSGALTAPRPIRAAVRDRLMAVQETRIVTKRLREFPEDSFTIDRYLATGGYESLQRRSR